jgi:hypothetical protein
MHTDKFDVLSYPQDMPFQGFFHSRILLLKGQCHQIRMALKLIQLIQIHLSCLFT